MPPPIRAGRSGGGNRHPSPAHRIHPLQPQSTPPSQRNDRTPRRPHSPPRNSVSMSTGEVPASIADPRHVMEWTTFVLHYAECPRPSKKGPFRLFRGNCAGNSGSIPLSQPVRLRRKPGRELCSPEIWSSRQQHSPVGGQPRLADLSAVVPRQRDEGGTQ
jgi:hypothetical protein